MRVLLDIPLEDVSRSADFSKLASTSYFDIRIKSILNSKSFECVTANAYASEGDPCPMLFAVNDGLPESISIKQVSNSINAHKSTAEPLNSPRTDLLLDSGLNSSATHPTSDILQPAVFKNENNSLRQNFKKKAGQEQALRARQPYSGNQLIFPTLPCPGIIGLGNLGNTCYMNSALQCLLQTPPLIHYFLSIRSPKRKGDVAVDTHAMMQTIQQLFETRMTWFSALNKTNAMGSKLGLVTVTFARLVRRVWIDPWVRRGIRMWERKTHSEKTLNVVDQTSIEPGALKKQLGLFNEMFRGHEQQDSQEFLQVLLDAMSEDLKPIVPASEIAAKGAITEESVKVASPITTMFQGLLKSHIECITCNTVSTKLDPFTLLSLPISNGVTGAYKPKNVESVLFFAVQGAEGRSRMRAKISFSPSWDIKELKEYVWTEFNDYWCTYNVSKQERCSDFSDLVIFEVRRSTIIRIFNDWECAVEAVIDDSRISFFGDGVFVLWLQNSVNEADWNLMCSAFEWSAEPIDNAIAYIPVYFSGKKALNGSPLMITLPERVDISCCVSKILVDKYPDWEMAAFDGVIQNRGEMLYFQLIKAIDEFGGCEFGLFQDAEDEPIDPNEILRRYEKSLLEEKDYMGALKTRLIKWSERKPDQCLVPIDGLFEVILCQKLDSAGFTDAGTQKSKFQGRENFFRTGFRSNLDVAYPIPNPAIQTVPEDYEFWSDLLQSHQKSVLAEENNKLIFEAAALLGVGQIVNYSSQCYFGGETVLLVSLQPAVMRLLFSQLVESLRFMIL
ncbi:ubiquitin carboxyl-terminal hydrolase [Entophlyctis luteolus]|nr:ubiquitin carboxyl-terminal hydrolase [Entophlyctis luteolus]